MHALIRLVPALLLAVGCVAGPTVNPPHIPEKGAAAGSPTKPSVPSAAPQRITLASGNWEASNHAILEEWLNQVVTRANGKPRVAAFDFDNTCIFHDAGEATLRYQLDNLELRLTPEEMAELFPKSFGDVTHLESGVALAEASADILAAYNKLWPYIRRKQVKKALGTSVHQDFRAKVLWFYDEGYTTPGMGADYAYALLPQLLAHMTPAEVADLTVRAIRSAQAEEPGRGTYQSGRRGYLGRVSHTYSSGLRAQPEMIDLQRALQKAGVEVFIVSASAEQIVEAAVRELGYPVDPDHVYGVRVELDGAGRLTTTAAPSEDYPLTYRAGKVELIQRFLPGAPLLVAGDTFTDYEMLVDFEETEVRLVINRNIGREMAELYSQALAAGDRIPSPGQGRVILQGRDENLGAFRPSRETIPLGDSQAIPLN